MEKIKLHTPDGFELDTWYSPGTSDKGIIFAHGMTVEKEDEEIFVAAAQKLQKHGFATLLFDFRGHGKSSGDPMIDFTIPGELIDLETAIAFMQEKGIHQIGLAGASFGGGIAALYAARHPSVIQAVLLANPLLTYDDILVKPRSPKHKHYYTNLEERLKNPGYVEMGRRKFPLGPNFFASLRNYSPIDELVGFSGPILIIHGDHDDYVLVEDSRLQFEKLTSSKKQLVIIAGANHGFHLEPYKTDATGRTIHFILENISDTHA